jgi:hypothetical protein
MSAVKLVAQAFTENFQWYISVAQRLFRTHGISWALNEHQRKRFYEMKLRMKNVSFIEEILIKF